MPPEPGVQGVEDELAAAEGVLARAGDFIVDAQAEALLEVWARVCNVAPYVALHLQENITFPS